MIGVIWADPSKFKGQVVDTIGETSMQKAYELKATVQ